MNLYEIGLVHIVWGVSKVTHDSYHEIWWKCFISKIYWHIWIFWGVRGGDVHIPPYIFCLLFKKIDKVQQHDLYLNKILHYIIILIKKNNENNGPTPISLGSEYSSSNWGIAILLTPGIFLIQIVNTSTVYICI